MCVYLANTYIFIYTVYSIHIYYILYILIHIYIHILIHICIYTYIHTYLAGCFKYIYIYTYMYVFLSEKCQCQLGRMYGIYRYVDIKFININIHMTAHAVFHTLWASQNMCRIAFRGHSRE